MYTTLSSSFFWLIFCPIHTSHCAESLLFSDIESATQFNNRQHNIFEAYGQSVYCDLSTGFTVQRPRGKYFVLRENLTWAWIKEWTLFSWPPADPLLTHPLKLAWNFHDGLKQWKNEIGKGLAEWWEQLTSHWIKNTPLDNSVGFGSTFPFNCIIQPLNNFGQWSTTWK